MSFEEKNTWVFAFIAVTGYAVYLVLLFSQASGRPLSEVDYVWPMAGTILGAIVVGILGAIVVAIVSAIVAGKDDSKTDLRDKQIGRFGEQVGNSFIVIGALGALILCFFAAPHFWIANLLYLCFVLAGVLSSAAKLVAYRRGLHEW
jgi:MFS family permease